MAFEVSSVPLSLTMLTGRLRWLTMMSSCRATRVPDRGGIGHQRQALARAIVDHRQDAEPSAARHLVRDEVQAPALVGPQRKLVRPKHGIENDLDLQFSTWDFNRGVTRLLLARKK